MLKGIDDPALIKRVSNVHQDDIHGICTAGDSTLVTGSKDGQVKRFDFVDLWKYSDWYGKTIVNNQKKGGNSYERWVTALDVFSDDSVVVGFRDGRLFCKNVFTSKIYTNLIMNGVVELGDSTNKKNCKKRNENRITGLKCLEFDGNFTALVGMPQGFHHFDCTSRTVMGTYTFRRPDWAYGFCRIAPNKMVAIHACTMSSFKFHLDESSKKSEWQLKETLIPEGSKEEGQRPFISSVNSFEKHEECTNNLCVSFFGGATSVFDVESSTVVHRAREHQQRVWQAVPISTNEFISCSDDATVKIWDKREANSVHTYTKHPGRVSSVALLPDQDKCFVAGTCANDSHSDEYKGQLFFYDMRKNQASGSGGSPIRNTSSGNKSLNSKLSKLSI